MFLISARDCDQFDSYYIPPTQATTGTEDTASGMCITTSAFGADTYTLTDGQSPPGPQFHYGGSFVRDAVQAFQRQVKAGPRDELQQYLSSGVEDTTDILGWWGVSPMYISEHQLYLTY